SILSRTARPTTGTGLCPACSQDNSTATGSKGGGRLRADCASTPPGTAVMDDAQHVRPPQWKRAILRPYRGAEIGMACGGMAGFAVGAVVGWINEITATGQAHEDLFVGLEGLSCFAVGVCPVLGAVGGSVGGAAAGKASRRPWVGLLGGAGTVLALLALLRLV